MGRAEKVDYRISMLVVLCKDCNMDVGLYPARHQCQKEGLPPLPIQITEPDAKPAQPLYRKASSPSLSRIGSTRQEKTHHDTKMNRAKSTASTTWTSRFGKSNNEKAKDKDNHVDSDMDTDNNNNNKNNRNGDNNENGRDNDNDDMTSYLDHYTPHLPAVPQQHSSLRKKWGTAKQNEKWKQLGEKDSDNKNGKLWKKWIQLKETVFIQDDQGPESDASDWEGESHVSRILRQYHEKKSGNLPPWLLDRHQQQDIQSSMSRHTSTSRRRLWEQASNELSAREVERQSFRNYSQETEDRNDRSQRSPSLRQKDPVSHYYHHSQLGRRQKIKVEEGEDDDNEEQGRSNRMNSHMEEGDHYHSQKGQFNHRLDRIKSARRYMDDDRHQQHPGTGPSRMDDIFLLKQAQQVAITRSRSDRVIQNTYQKGSSRRYLPSPSNHSLADWI